MIEYLEELLRDAEAAPDTAYRQGYIDAVVLILQEVEYREDS
jgi:hypothetical protein